MKNENTNKMEKSEVMNWVNNMRPMVVNREKTMQGDHYQLTVTYSDGQTYRVSKWQHRYSEIQKLFNETVTCFFINDELVYTE